nr:reverse transcriptase domain-containing protein [Tanacetum cinerariifolium]
MIQQVQQSYQYHGLPSDDANKHIDKFLIVTQSMKQNGIPDDIPRLCLFPYSLKHHATAWVDHLPKKSIHSWEEMVTKMSQSNQQVNVVNPSCKTCGGSHHYSECQVADGFNQGDVYDAARNYNAGEKALNERPQGALSSNTILNHRVDTKVITTLSGITLAGPLIPSLNPLSSSKEVERDLETTMDQVHISSLESTARVPSPMFKKLHFNISVAEALAQMPKYAKILKDLLTNKEKLLELDNTPFNENCSVKSIHPLSGSLTPSFDPIIASLSPSLTPFGDSDFLLEETDTFLALDDSIPPKINNEIYDSEGDILSLEKLLIDDPVPIPRVSEKPLDSFDPI